MNNESQARKRGRPVEGESKRKNRVITIEDSLYSKAKEIGGGNASLGIRMALQSWPEIGQ